MKKTVVIYQSKYGSTKCYAQWISQALSCPVFERKDIRPDTLETYDTIIYGGGLYAGGVNGIDLLIKNFNRIRSKNIILFTCGLADPDDPANTKQIQISLDKVLSPQMKEKIRMFHLRGGIDYSRLSVLHRVMMAGLRKMLKKKSRTSPRQEDQEFLKTYGQTVDFTDRESIRPLVDYVLSLSQITS